jgi:hypothetical protein
MQKNNIDNIVLEQDQWMFEKVAAASFKTQEEVGKMEFSFEGPPHTAREITQY